MATWGQLQIEESIPEARQGRGQGYFRYYKSSGKYETIAAVNGRLLRDGADLPITGLDTFQTDRMIEAVQWKDRMFIATGTKLVEYDGQTAKVVTEYKPKPLEFLYVGSNALAPFPDDFMEDGQHDFLRVDALVPNMRKGISGTPVTFTTFISKPGTEVIEYKYEYKLAKRSDLVLGKNWSTDKTWTFTPKDIGDYVIQVSARIKGTVDEPPTDAPEVFTIPVYKVTAFDENVKIDSSQMHTCNRILLHWERIILYGDLNNPRTMYVSHLQNPRYFPTNNTLEFENNEMDPLQKILQYRDALVAFMTTSIQVVHGKAPIGEDPYRRQVVHTGIGCIAPETPRVMGNYVAFLSGEGVFILKSVYGSVDEKMNVERIDGDVRKGIPESSLACAVVYDDQYHLCFPEERMRWRFYIHLGVWVHDISPRFDFCRLFEFDGDMVGQSFYSGNSFRFDEMTYDDAGFVFESLFDSKDYDFKETHNPKKLKQARIILRNFGKDTNAKVKVYGDNELIADTNSYAEIETNEAMNIMKIPLAPENKTRTARMVVTHAVAEEFLLQGIGFIFKIRKP